MKNAVISGKIIITFKGMTTEAQKAYMHEQTRMFTNDADFAVKLLSSDGKETIYEITTKVEISPDGKRIPTETTDPTT